MWNIGVEGKVFCFTGKFTYVKSDCEMFVLQHGGDVKSGFNQAVTHLVVGDYDSNAFGRAISSKEEKARKFNEKGGNVEIINEKDIEQMIG
ncbi:BRCT domain-containing protein [Persicobacter psychrovividus]|uniref:BRCT domain-containing protein n=1 Tax=Persicobacter psychrovividus TaxID=387638 RepID=A0ABN6LHB7_9BACT|nr:hypothetical protein PEPS_46410 [Persicobacter psychrovividus]